MTKQWGTPGPRAIHPEMCDSPSLGACGLLANALFPRLIAQADDQGRLAGEAHAILVQCMGRHLRTISVDQIDEALQQLEEAEIIERYTAGRAEYVQIVAWWRWQSGQRRAYPSRWPAPKGWTDLVYGCSMAPEGQDSADIAARNSSPRNAALRGSPLQRAADRSNPRPRAQAPTHAPSAGTAGASTVPDTVPSRGPRAAANGAARGGPTKSAGEVMSEFQMRVPRPGEVQP